MTAWTKRPGLPAAQFTQGSRAAAPPADESTWQKLLARYAGCRQLVRHRGHGKARSRCCRPSRVLPRENLKLRLLSAALALLSRDEDSFKHDEDRAGLGSPYFDTKSGDGANLIPG